MKTRTFAILIVFLINIIIINQAYAADYDANPKGGVISGRVLDASSNIQMEYVNIAVFNAADSSLVTGTISLPDGNFAIENLPIGNYFLKLTFIGFENLVTENVSVTSASAKIDLGDLKMATLSLELNGVSVVAERSKVEYQIDKRIINVGKDLVAQGGTAVSVLENTPSVQVDPQGNLTLRGSSDYIVLIDGKPSAMKGNDVLKTISAASIKQIEVITNPSAKYESDGTAGIINIIQKKDKLQGISGTTNLSLGTSNKYNGSALINFRKNKLNIFAGLDLLKNEYLSQLKMHNRTFLENDSQLLNDSIERYNRNSGVTAKAGFDYDLNDNNAISVSGSLGEMHFDNGSYSRYNISFDSSEQKNYFVSNNDYFVKGLQLDLNGNYTHKFGEKHTLTLSNTYSSWNGYDDGLIPEYTTDQNYSNPQTHSSLMQRKDNFSYNYRLNADYTLPIKTATLELGFQYRYEYRFDDFVFKNLDVENNVWELNNMFTYKLDYFNDIYSGYATFSDKKGSFGYMLGLRSEFFDRTIEFSNDAEAHDYSKFMLYPSVHLTKSFQDKHNFQVSYSRRINRPTPYTLNQTPTYIDPFTVTIGNPDLEPEFTDAFELNYRTSYKILTFNVQTYLRNTSNSFQQRIEAFDNGIMVIEMFNAKSQQAYGAELGVDLNLTKWWQLSSGVNLYNLSITSQIDNDNKTKNINTWDGRVISNFTLKWGTRIQALGYYRANYMDVSGKGSSMYIVNIALNQSMMNNKLNIGLSANNILNSVKFNYKSTGINYNNNINVQGEGMVLMFTASYSFNNFQNKQRGRADAASFKSGGMF